VGQTLDASLPTRFFEDAEKEIVGVDGGHPRCWEDECLRVVVPADRPPPFKLCLDRNGKPYIRIAAFGLCFDLTAICDARIDSKAVLHLVVPAKRKKLTGPETQHQESSDDPTVTLA